MDNVDTMKQGFLPLSIGRLCAWAMLFGMLLSACQPATEADAARATGTAVCGRVTVADMSWASAQWLAQVDEFILTHGYGCTVERVPGDTLPTLNSMTTQGQPDVAPEVWLSAVRQQVDQAVAAGQLFRAAPVLKDGGVEGWWIPRYLARARPDIKTLDDALRHPELFASGTSPGQGVVHNCPAGWNCHTTTRQAFKAWGAAEKGFVLFDSLSAAELDESIIQAHQRQQGWLGYYWAPTALVGRYDMVRLKAGVAHQPRDYEHCNTRPDCTQPGKTDWPVSEVVTLVSSRLQQTGGTALAYLGQRSLERGTVNRWLAWMQEQQASPAEAAKEFLKTEPERWQAWVNPVAAEKIRQALGL